jgi:hypothetical protein
VKGTDIRDTLDDDGDDDDGDDDDGGDDEKLFYFRTCMKLHISVKVVLCPHSPS